MKNALNYYYNLYPTSIHQINDSYKCYINNEEYLLTPYHNDIKLINKVYALSNYLLDNNIPCHKIIQNNNSHLLTIINNVNYTLLKVFVKNRNVNIDDIVFFSSVYVDKKYFDELSKSDWYQMWTKKIDYLEYQVSQVGMQYPLIRESVSYYIGMAENSISLFSNVSTDNNMQLVIGHNRIKKNDGVIDFYNPLNFILDSKVRDLSEYIKEKFFFSKYTLQEAITDITKFNLQSNEYILLFARLLFPSYYFDCYEEILHKNKNENELAKIIYKNESYIIFLKEIHNFLKQKTTVPDIDWIIKT